MHFSNNWFDWLCFYHIFSIESVSVILYKKKIFTVIVPDLSSFYTQGYKDNRRNKRCSRFSSVFIFINIDWYFSFSGNLEIRLVLANFKQVILTSLVLLHFSKIKMNPHISKYKTLSILFLLNKVSSKLRIKRKNEFSAVLVCA